MEIPERFRVDDDDEEDAGKVASNDPDAYAAQSLYGVIAQASKKEMVLQPALHQESGSDTESEWEDGARRGSADATFSAESSSRPPKGPTKADASDSRGQKLSEHRLIRSFMLKPIRERRESIDTDAMSQSQFLPPKGTIPSPSGRFRDDAQGEHDATIMDRKLKSKVKVERESASSSRQGSYSGSSETDGPSKARVALSEVLADIFQFDEPEEIVDEFECWYLQSVLLPGSLFVTKKHLCFYAYMQKKGNVTTKSGHFSKQGKRSPRYRRYWFTLKGDVLSYYSSAAEPYFPSGSIDLRFAVEAELARGNDKKTIEDTTNFSVTSDKRTYYFRADSPSSAKEWVRSLQKVIFRSHNDGDSVKISLPLENIMDVEENAVIGVATTVKVKIISDDTTYAVDEYYFTFFNKGHDALDLLQSLTSGNDAKQAAAEMDDSEGRPPVRKSRASFRRSASLEQSSRLSSPAALPRIPEAVRSTLSPLVPNSPTSPRLSGDSRRASGDFGRPSMSQSRASFERGRRSRSISRKSGSRQVSKSPLSAVPSRQHSTLSGTAPDDMSASQMLSRDDAFRSPTLRIPKPHRAVSESTGERRGQHSYEQSPTVLSGDQSHGNPSQSRSGSEVETTTSPIELQESRDGSPSEQQQRPWIGSSQSTLRQHAFHLAGVVRESGKRVSALLSSNPKNYYDKFSAAITGGKRHYSENEALAPDESIRDPKQDLDTALEETAEHERRFQEHFALPATERLRAVFYCWLHKVLPLYGKVYISDRRFCFRSLLYGTRTKLVVPFRDIEDAAKEKGFRWGYPGMVVVVRGHEELFFDFGTQGLRDDCVVTILRGLDVTKKTLESVVWTEEEREEAEAAERENDMLRMARKGNYTMADPLDLRHVGAPILADDRNASVIDSKPQAPLRVTCLTIGSRGDVQPYIALCKGLIGEGHSVKIATHRQFESWIRGHGIEFAPVDGDPAELMRVCVDNGMFTPAFLFEANSKFRGWLDDLLRSSWTACQDSDLLIESPSAMAGIHIAEALAIPYFRAFTMPWTRTRAYPHAFAVPTKKWGGNMNWTSYAIFDNVFWAMTSGQINRWRRKTLGLRPTDNNKLQTNKVPFLYNFSPAVVIPPLDWSDWIRITGYWFLDEASAWTPPADLVNFLEDARAAGRKIVYIGFGSVPFSDSKLLTEQIVCAVEKARVSCILSKGWSDHFTRHDPSTPEVVLPSTILPIRAAPHDWLFTRIDAVVHHGGAGTTGASLRAGLPTVIKPFFGDQFFFATRVEDLGVGIHLRKLTGIALGKAMWIALHDTRMLSKARVLGERIRGEDGVATAIQAIYRDWEYAKSLIKRRPPPSSQADEPKEVKTDDEGEESWTFVEKKAEEGSSSGRHSRSGEEGAGAEEVWKR